MSMQQVYSIIGPPTSTNSHITGKAFIPFNFRGKDSYRSIAHYKGQGRIVFSNSSAYSSDQRALEVHMDPNASGFQKDLPQKARGGGACTRPSTEESQIGKECVSTWR